MSVSRLPLSVAEKHRILYTHAAPAAELQQLGHRHKDAGYLHDALDFYQRAGAADDLKALAPLAVDTADLVLLLNLYRALDQEPDPSSVQALHDRAVELGKESVARRAALLLVPKR